MVAPRKKISAVVTLFFVTPLVAEYLLGDLTLKLLPALIVLAPAYGGGAILIRETARRTGRGWPMMLMLGAAYSLIAEGLVTQSLFNHDYLKMHMHLLQHAYIPALGVGGWSILFALNLHTFWSIGVSIALVEALFGAEAETPWLGRVGAFVVIVMFALGAAANFEIGFKQNQFVASWGQLLGAAMVSALVIASAFLIRPGRRHLTGGMAPSPWIAGAVAFVLGIAVLKTPPQWGWAAVGALLAIDTVFLILVAFYSRRTGWSALHTQSLAAGGALAYGILAFTRSPLAGGLLWMRISNAFFSPPRWGSYGWAREVLYVCEEFAAWSTHKYQETGFSPTVFYARSNYAKSLVPYRQCSACRSCRWARVPGAEQCGYGDLR